MDINELEDVDDTIKIYASILYNLQSIKLYFPENSIWTNDHAVHIVCNIHCTFKFTNTKNEIVNMMEDIVDILGQNNIFEDFLSSSTKVDPQNKLTEKMKKHVFGTTAVPIKEILIMNKSTIATILGVASLSLLKKYGSFIRWGRAGSGILFVCPEDGSILLFERSYDVLEPKTWGIVGGRIDDPEDESAWDSAQKNLLKKQGV